MPVVYKITNTITNKSYIGWTSKNTDARWNEHTQTAARNKDNRKFYNAIRKYGTDVWETETICETESNEEAKVKEIFYIELFESYTKGYNSTKGGDGNNGIVMSKDSNIARSNALRGKKKDPSTIEKFKQRKQTEQTKKAISEAHIGMKKPWVKWTNEQIAKRAMTRRSLSYEQYVEIKRLRDTGLTIKSISSLTGITCDLVKKWLKKEWVL